ncbi:MAG TPA: efflux RND transporter permease subunit, partial [Verrucomicrobiae bacterium]|nr:efflux RND transporter permease subunit [Verrucomicrobiae bacterium]
VVLVDAGLRDARDISRVAVPTGDGASLTVGSLGEVRLGVAPLEQQMSFDATHAVSLSFYALPGADSVRMADAIKARMERLAERLPAGTAAHVYWDATDLIVASQASLRDAIFAGALLALGVIFFFLRDARMTLVAAIVIPCALSIAVLVISLLGATLNIMSVGGLAIAVGLIIDDAIVVIEGIAAHGGVEHAMRRLIGPMTASTLTTVVVFLPLGLLGGVAGSFFRALALTLTCALLVSLALALFVTPTLVRAVAGKRGAHAPSASVGRALARYAPLLRWALNRRRTVYAIGGAALLATVALLATLPSDFLPALDEGQFEIAYRMPVGTSIAASDAAATAMERVVASDPAVASEGRFTGIDTNGFSPTPVRDGILRVKLKPLGQRDSFDAIADRLREELAEAVPSAQYDVHQILEDMIDDVSGAPAPIEIVVSGGDQTALAAAATRVAKAIAGVPGIVDVFSGVERDDPARRVTPDFARLARAGSGTPGLVAALSAATSGEVATTLPEPAMLVPVRVSVAGAAGALPPALSLGGAAVPLDQVARSAVDRSATDVTEINGQRVMIVTANVAGASLSSAVDGVRAALPRAQLAPVFHAQIEGAYRAQQDSFAQFAVVIAAAVLLVFFVMLVCFGSFRQPLVILAAVPLAPIGVAIALALTRTSFNVSSFMGMLLLVGLVVKNGILFIDAANRNRRAGFGVARALELAGNERLRPILMTTFAAIGGLLPLAFGIGAGAAMERPLAIAVVGGLSTATFFTLLLIPALYAGVAGREVPA